MVVVNGSHFIVLYHIGIDMSLPIGADSIRGDSGYTPKSIGQTIFNLFTNTADCHSELGVPIQ